MKKEEILKELAILGIEIKTDNYKELQALLKEAKKPKETTQEKAIDIKLDEKEAPKVKRNPERKALLEAYKIQNPVKFESKGFAEELKNL